MNKMHRFLIAGSSTFNNYFLMYRYLQQYLPKNVIICNGGSDGADKLASVYANCNGHPYEAYLVDSKRFKYNAKEIRDRELVKMVDHAIFFWDGKSPKTGALINMLKQRNIVPVIIDVTAGDIIHPHIGRVVNMHKDSFDIYIGRGKGSIWANPFPLSDDVDRLTSIALFTDGLLKNMNLLQKLTELKGAKLGCFCSPKLCHGDMLIWLLDNALNEIKAIISENQPITTQENNHAKYPQVALEVLLPRWTQKDPATQLYTTTDLLISKGFIRTLVVHNKLYVECSDNQIVKDSLYMTMKERELVESEPPSLYYESLDGTKIEIFYRQHSFEDDPFKVGKWYINVSGLK